jgi:hypothetical protein
MCAQAAEVGKDSYLSPGCSRTNGVHQTHAHARHRAASLSPYRPTATPTTRLTNSVPDRDRHPIRIDPVPGGVTRVVK